MQRKIQGHHQYGTPCIQGTSSYAMIKRAAQFAPFSALKGYEEAQEEAIRRNEDRFI